MNSYYIEVRHVDASDDSATDYMTEWQIKNADSEREAMDAITLAWLARGRAVTSQLVLETTKAI